MSLFRRRSFATEVDLTYHYLDSSSLVKLFVREAGASEMHDYMSRLQHEILVTATISTLEIRSAIRRRQMAKELSDIQAFTALNSLASVSKVLRLIAHDSAILPLATEVIDRTAMKALDAIQLGTALWMEGQLIGSEELVFVSSDLRLLRAAEKEGFVTWNPSR